MSRTRAPTLLGLVESYFRDQLGRIRGASPHTVRAYRDTLRLLFTFLAERRARPVAALTLDDLDVESVMAFLAHLEAGRANTAASRNARLAALRTFFRHLIEHDLERAAQYQRVLALPSKRTQVPVARYLEPEDVKRILAQPDRNTNRGRRDYALLLFLYNTGARVGEALTIRLEHLSLAAPRQVRLLGKGNKQRLCPLWPDTVRALQQLPSVQQGAPVSPVFCNRAGQPLSRDGVAWLLRKYVAQATRTWPGLRRQRVTPHVLRHSCAVALLQAGIDVTVIRDYLGHASIATTSRYIATNLQMKRDALDAFWRRAGLTPIRQRPWTPKPDLLALLASL